MLFAEAYQQGMVVTDIVVTALVVLALGTGVVLASRHLKNNGTPMLEVQQDTPATEEPHQVAARPPRLAGLHVTLAEGIQISGDEMYRLLTWMLALHDKTAYRDIKGQTQLPLGFTSYMSNLAKMLGYLEVDNVPTLEIDVEMYAEQFCVRDEMVRDLVTHAKVLCLTYESYLEHGKQTERWLNFIEFRTIFVRDGLMPSAETFAKLQAAYDATTYVLDMDPVGVTELTLWLLKLVAEYQAGDPQVKRIPQPSSYGALSGRLNDLASTTGTNPRTETVSVKLKDIEQLAWLLTEYTSYLHVLHRYFVTLVPESPSARELKASLPAVDILEQLEHYEDIHFPEI